MEDNDGYSLGDRIDEIIKRKHITVNGKELHIPRKLSERIYGRCVEDYKRSKVLYKDNGEIWARTCGGYRYKPTALSRAVTDKVQSRLAQDFAEQLQSAESVKGDSLDASEVHNIALLERSDCENRNVFQQRLLREFYKNSKF